MKNILHARNLQCLYFCDGPVLEGWNQRTKHRNTSCMQWQMIAARCPMLNITPALTHLPTYHSHAFGPIPLPGIPTFKKHLSMNSRLSALRVALFGCGSLRAIRRGLHPAWNIFGGAVLFSFRACGPLCPRSLMGGRLPDDNNWYNRSAWMKVDTMMAMPAIASRMRQRSSGCPYQKFDRCRIIARVLVHDETV